MNIKDPYNSPPQKPSQEVADLTGKWKQEEQPLGYSRQMALDPQRILAARNLLRAGKKKKALLVLESLIVESSDNNS